MTLHLVLRSMDALDALPAGSWVGIVRRERFRPYEKEDDGTWWSRNHELDPDDLIWGARVLHLPGIAVDEHDAPWQHEGHNPVQHRDRRPPWCGACGWSSPVPAQPAVQVRVVDGAYPRYVAEPSVVDVETGDLL